MSADLLLRHIASLEATVAQQQVGLELVGAQLAGLKAYVRQITGADRAEIVVPETCRKYQSTDCARQCEEAVIELGGMGGSPTQLMCRGCGQDPRTPV